MPRAAKKRMKRQPMCSNYPNYSVSMTDMNTRETKIIPMDIPWQESSFFWWTEGNFSCDCNRSLTFYPGVGYPCGDGRFKVNYFEFPDGKRCSIR